jgi:hypothetical protein
MQNHVITPYKESCTFLIDKDDFPFRSWQRFRTGPTTDHSGLKPTATDWNIFLSYVYLFIFITFILKLFSELLRFSFIEESWLNGLICMANLHISPSYSNMNSSGIKLLHSENSLSTYTLFRFWFLYVLILHNWILLI